MNTLDYIRDRFNLDLKQKAMPIEIPDFGRDNLAEMLAELSFKVGVEVGVCDGTYSAKLAKHNPQMKLYGVDPFIPYEEYTDYRKKSTFEGMVNNATKNLAPYMDRYEFIRKFSMDAVKDFEDGSLDFVYIDANHDFVNVTNDIYHWSKKVRTGGIVAGHDYVFTGGHSAMHVKHVLPAYCAAWGIKPWFVLGREATDEGLIRDSSRSWMFVK